MCCSDSKSESEGGKHGRIARAFPVKSPWVLGLGMGRGLLTYSSINGDSLEPVRWRVPQIPFTWKCPQKREEEEEGKVLKSTPSSRLRLN